MSRPLSPAIQLVYDRPDQVSAIIDNLLEAVAGKRLTFTILVYSDEPGCATMSLTNAKSREAHVAALGEFLDELRRDGASKADQS